MNRGPLLLLLWASLLAGIPMTAVGGTTSPAPSTPSVPIPGTHNCDGYYPDASRHENQSGTVLVRYDVLADGSTTHVAISKSSGSPLLDSIAVRCVAERWRNTVARRAGIPIVSPGHEARIRFIAPRPPNPWPGRLYLLISAAIVGVILLVGRRQRRLGRIDNAERR